jgi:Asp-tRNA(Asn)/Glu-tRNA(Gln) amidotransferase A subunit family amidase
MTKSVGDAALLLQVIAGADPRDPSSSAQPVPDYSQALAGEIKGLKIGLPREYFADHMDGEVREAVRAVIQVLADQGAAVEEVSLPHCRYAPAAFVGLVLPEASCGHVHYLKTRAQEYGSEVRGLLYAGLLLPASRYVQAQRARTLIIQDLSEALQRVDVLALPTVAMPAPRIGQQSVTLGDKTVNVIAALARFTLPFNLAGLPAMTVPCGFTSDGLPIGLQIAGRAFAEPTILRVAHAHEAQTSWHRQHPPL